MAVLADPTQFLVELAARIPSSYPSMWEVRFFFFSIQKKNNKKIFFFFFLLEMKSWVADLATQDNVKSESIWEEAQKPLENFLNPTFVCHMIEEVADPNAIFIADG